MSGRRLHKFICSVFLCLGISVLAHAAIQIDLDVEAVDAQGSTASTKVFVERVEISFPDRRTSTTVKPGARDLYAIARFKYVGNGALTARWLVDDRVISQQSFVLTFGKEVEIRSDQNNAGLPTFEPGYHKVSLQLVNSSGLIDESARSIRYFVGDGAAASSSVRGIDLRFPNRQLVDVGNFYFRWQGHKDFASYFLEVERLGAKATQKKTVIKSLTRLDLFSPDDAQRAGLSAGAYRWRVTAYGGDRSLPPVVSEWASFDIQAGEASTGVVIQDIRTRELSDDTGLSAGSITRTLADVDVGKSTDQTLALLGNGRVSSGGTYQLELDVRSTSPVRQETAQVVVRNNGALLRRYSVGLEAGKVTRISIPMQAATSNSLLLQNLSVQLLDSDVVLDEAAINVSIEPRLRLDAIDFNELSEVASGAFAITDPNGCAVGDADSSMAFSRMVSAQIEGQVETTQSLLQQGYFNFDQGQQVRFTAFFKDKGLGAWFDGPSGNCFVQMGGRAVRVSSHPLQFVAQPLNHLGQAVGDAIAIGEISFQTGFEGLVVSPVWHIPVSGQYRISLHNLGEAADLYATLPGGYPKYIHAAGFVTELQSPVTAGSQMMAGTPRQAIISGEASTRWRGDVGANVIPLILDQVSVSMMNNPLHAALSGGVMTMKKAPNMPVPQLRLFGQTHGLHELILGLSGASANLDYHLPETFQQASGGAVYGGTAVQHSTAVSTSAFSNTTFSGSGSDPVASFSGMGVSGADNTIMFENVDVINGGEFVAQYEFDSSWQDQSIANGDIALRVRGSTLVVDASPILSYTAYTQAANFTGVGLYNSLLRVRVSGRNGLFDVANAEQAFIYGKAPWLYFQDDVLAGENIIVQAQESVQPFFNETGEDTFRLLQPYGFDLQISGGEFGLADSKVAGVNFSGQVRPDEQSPASQIMDAPLHFEHLVRSQSNDYQFSSESKNNSNLSWQVDAYEYRPQNIQLLIGEETRGRDGSAPDFTSFSPDHNQQTAEQWQTSLRQRLQSKAGLLATAGTLSRSWQIQGDGARSAKRHGAFLLRNTGLSGQWQETDDGSSYKINNFDTRISHLWLKFIDSAVIDSDVSGFLDIPYPVAQSFRFTGKLDQQAELLIPADGLSFVDGDELVLGHWHARLKNVSLPSVGDDISVSTRATAGQLGFTYPIIYNRELQRIELSAMRLTLDVDERLGGQEFISESGRPPFTIDTDILPDGQLARTRAYPVDEPLFFLGQSFEVSDIRFAPYFASPDPQDRNIATAQPLVDVEGTVFFKVFGSRQIKVQHTALGAQVPEITSLQQGDYGEGVIKVSARLKFVNSYAMNEQVTGEYAQQAGTAAVAAGVDAQIETQPFKAFVGTADLVIINAVSIRGLAEAGLHPQQSLTEGRWQNANINSIKAYERIGLGAGADVLKATIAGLQGIETATKLGGAVVSAAAGVDGTGEQAIDLATEAVTFVESVAVAAAVTAGTSGAGSDTIRRAVGNGLSMTNSGIELLKTVCDERSDCDQDKSLLLDISSLLVRVAGSLTRFEDLTPQQIASISLQTLDVGIPLLMKVDLDTAYAMTGAPPLNINGANITLDDKKNAALSVAHVGVSASRILVDNNMSISFDDFLRISRQTVAAARNVKAVQGLEAGLSNLGMAQADQLMDLSLDMADASIEVAASFSGNGGDLQALPRLASQFVAVLCQQSTALQPLLAQAGVSAAGDIVQQPLNLTQAVLRKTAQGNLPQNPAQTLAQLQQLLQSLSTPDSRLQGCGQSRIQLPAAVRAVLSMAAHSLQPVDGSLVDNTGAQIAWAMRSVNLSVEMLESLAQQIGLNGLPAEVAQVKTVLSRLSLTFAQLGSDLSLTDTGQGISAQAVLKLAQGIPEAMRELVENRSSQAVEILDLHIVLMRELQPLLSNADSIRAGDISNVDLYALPVAVISEVQDLSQLDQCQKSALSNLSMSMSIARQLSQESSDVALVINNMDRLYENIKACDRTGISQSRNIAQFMQVMKLMLAIYEDPAQLRSIVDAAVPRLLPVFVDSSQQILGSIQAFTQALPIADFTQDNRTQVLDTVLVRLLDEAEENSRDAVSRSAIQEARSIINHADLNMTGLTISRDPAGQVIEIKELRADGAMRQFNLQAGAARQFYPQAHPRYAGGLDELIFQVILVTPFEQLATADQQSLFTPFWDDLIERGEVQQRRYRDAQKNHVAISRMSDTVQVQVVDAVSYAAFTPNRLFSIATMPAREVSASTLDDQMQALLSAEIYREYGEQNPGCIFSTGCAYRSITGSGRFSVQSVSNPHLYAIYSDDRERRSSLDDFRPAGNLFEFSGYIDHEAADWNPAWKVYFDNSGELTLKRQNSQETLDVGEQFDITSPAQIPALLAGVDQFVHRRVVDGNNIWEYIAGGNIVHSYGDGNWEIYAMPESLPAGSAVPAPDQILDVASLQLLARGDRSGIIEDPAGLSASLPAGEPVLVIAAANNDETIRIDLTGEDAGEVSIGQVNLAVAANSDVAVDQITSTEQQADGSQLITQDNGDTTLIHGSVDDNLRITQNTTILPRISSTGLNNSVYQRQVTIQYCTDKNKSWANCPTAERFERRFDYEWMTGDSLGTSYVDLDDAQRPVITPASGINRAVKHQFWRDIFTLEQTLNASPDEQGLQQLDSLIQRARDAGLPEDELQQQARYISAGVIDRLMIAQFEEADRYITDLVKQNAWKDNETASPVYKLSGLRNRLRVRGIPLNDNFVQHYLQLLNLNYRLYLHDLQDLEIIDSNVVLNAGLVKKIGAITDIMAQMVELNDESPITENFSFACDAIDRVKRYIQTQVIDDSSALVLESDVKLIFDLEENSSIMNCANSNSLLAAIDGLMQRVGGTGKNYSGMVEAMRLRRLAQAIVRQHPVQDDFNLDGRLDSQDIVYFYGQILSADALDADAAPTPEQYDTALQHILNLQRFLREINGERQRRGGDSAFDTSPVQALQQQLIDRLQQGLGEEYQRRYKQFVDTSLTTSLEDIISLAEHLERIDAINTSLPASAQGSPIRIDAQQYLKITIDGTVLDPQAEIQQQQTRWIDSLWPPSTLTNTERQTVVERLQKQDQVIRYLQENSGNAQSSQLRISEQQLIARTDAEMDELASILSAIQNPEELDAGLQILRQVTTLLHDLQMTAVQENLQQRVQQLFDQAVARIADNADNSLLEIQKILAITAAYEGMNGIAGTALASNSNIRAAIDEAGTAQLNRVNDGGNLDDIRAFIALVELEQQLGVDNPQWSVSDVHPRMNELIASAQSRLLSSNSLELIPAYMDLWATGQLIGLPANQDFAAVEAVIRSHRDSVSECIAAQNCRIEHMRRYSELSVALAELGADAGDFSNILQQMMSSSPRSMAESMGDRPQPPAFRDVVLRDKTGRGRAIVADALEKLGDGYQMLDAASRKALRLLIQQLKELAAMSLPAGHSKPSPDQDPLLVSAQRLQQKLDDWLTQLQQQIGQRVQQTGLFISNGVDALLTSLGISSAELNDIVLPEINGDVSSDVRIVPANKYRLAAEALQPVSYLRQDAALRLSFRLMNTMPDPAITAESDYRLASITQLALYMLDSSGQAIPDVINANTLKQTAVGGLVFALLNLPAEDRPVDALFDFAKQALMPSLLAAGSGDDTACDDIYACLLNSSLQLTANVLDSSLLSLQQNRSRLLSSDRQRLALGLLQKMARNLSVLSQQTPDDPLIFWTGIGAEVMNLSLQLVNNPVDEKNLLLASLQLSNRMLQSPLVDGMVSQIGQTIPQVDMAYGFVTGSSQMLVSQLQNNSDVHLPVAIARMAQNQLFLTLRRLNMDERLLDAGIILGNWQLDLADRTNTWALMTTANTDPVAWLDVMLGEGGITSLNSRINESGLLSARIPAALSLMPFITAHSLLNNQALLQDSRQSHKVMADLAADLSNSWFLPLDYNGAYMIPADSTGQILTDKPLAIMLRQLKTIEATDNARLKALKLVGNVGLGTMQIFLPDTALSDVMRIAWNGGSNGGTGIATVLETGLAGNVNPADVLGLVQGLPLSASEMLTAISDASAADRTAKLLRILSMTTQPGDLLSPDRSLNNPLFQSILVSLGEVRKIVAPQLVGEQHNTDTSLGYLRTVPFITMQGSQPEIASGADFASAMQDMVNLALDYNSGGTTAAVQEVSLGGVDISRLGINALAPLLERSRRSEVADIQQRAIFDGLVEGSDTPGFSGISGGLQTEWQPGSLSDRADSELVLEMYGQLAFPLMGKKVGLMQLVENETGSYLFFEAATDEGAGSRLVGGISGGIKAELRAMDEALSVAYWGQAELQILSNTQIAAQAAGVIDRFPNPADSSSPQDYASRLINDVSIAQCAQLETAILPFPFTLSGIGATSTLAALAEKDELGLTVGVRAGLSGEMNTPIIPSLLGIRLNGNITTSYGGELDPTDNSITMEANNCIATDVILKFLGRDITLNTQDIETQVSVTESPTDIITDIKLKITLSNSVVEELRGDACRGVSVDVVKEGICLALDTITGAADLWVVLHNDDFAGTPGSSQKMMFGIGAFPQANSAGSRFVEANITDPGLSISSQVGSWGGWDNSASNFELCSLNLCELNRFDAEPVSP